MAYNKCFGIKVRYPRKSTVLTGSGDLEEQVWYWYGDGCNSIEEQEAEIRKNVKAICRLVRKIRGMFDHACAYIVTDVGGYSMHEHLLYTIHGSWCDPHEEKLTVIDDPRGAWIETKMTDAEVLAVVLAAYREYGGLEK